MLLTHAVALAEARSHVAALADRARSTEASSAYEHLLLELDWTYGDDVPALDTVGLADDRALLFAGATSAIEELAGHGAEMLQIELLLALLDDACALDES